MGYCTTSLKAINYDCTPSKGGIVDVLIANYTENMFTVNTGSTSGITSGVPCVTDIVTADTTWYRYQFRRNTGSFTSTLNVDDANGVNYVSTEITLQFTRMEAQKRAAIAALAQGGVAVLVKDANGNWWAFGVEAPVFASSGTGQTGTAATDGNFYNIVLTDEQSSFPYQVAENAVPSVA